jgi:hypothetical protein
MNAKQEVLDYRLASFYVFSMFLTFSNLFRSTHLCNSYNMYIYSQYTFVLFSVLGADPVDWDKFTSDDQSSDNQFSPLVSTSSSANGFNQFSSNPLVAMNKKKKKQQSSSMHSQAELDKT